LNKNHNNNKCDKCNQRIHPNFIGYHKCGYANCAICKNAIRNSEYWDHTRSHPGHENDSPPSPRTSFGKRQWYSTNSSTRSFNRDSADVTQPQVGKEYEVDITEIGRHGDGIARIRGFVIFVKGGHIGEKIKIIITETGRRFAIARTA
jgi:predicted RNA-binding protein with TRAM domain